MAWIFDSIETTWDVAYFDEERANKKAEKLEKRYGVTVQVQRYDDLGPYVCYTIHPLGDIPHSKACRCEQCHPELFEEEEEEEEEEETTGTTLQRKYIGEVSVDTGHIWLGDPAYFIAREGKKSLIEERLGIGNWEQYCDVASKYSALHHDFDHLGVTVSSGMGDGGYPVFAKINDDGRVASVTVQFIAYEDEDGIDVEDEDEQSGSFPSSSKGDGEELQKGAHMKKGNRGHGHDLTPDERAALLHLRIQQDIEQFGCSVITVFGDKEGPGFAYSIGIPTTVPGSTEIAILGLNPDTQGHIINNVLRLMKEGQTFEAGKRYDGIIKNMPVYFGKVGLRYYEDYFGKAIEHYHGVKFPVLQLVWPDKQGKFPWEEGFEERFREAQPLLFEPPTDGQR